MKSATGQAPAKRLIALQFLTVVLPILVVTAPRDLALRRAVLPERRTGTTLG